jgi:hypothetical protein
MIVETDIQTAQWSQGLDRPKRTGTQNYFLLPN